MAATESDIGQIILNIIMYAFDIAASAFHIHEIRLIVDGTHQSKNRPPGHILVRGTHEGQLRE